VGRSFFVSRATFIAACAALLGCGGSDGPTTPGGTEPGGDTRALAVGLESARPNEFVTFRPTGLGRAVPDSVIGTLGTREFRAIRLDDSTLVGIVPTGATGTQTMAFDLDGHHYTAEITVDAPIVVTDPAAAASALFSRALARFDSVEVGMQAGASNGADTSAVRSFITAGRATIAQAKATFFALTVEEQRAAIPYIVAEAAAVGLDVAAAPSADLGASSAVTSDNFASASLCTAVTSFQNCAAFSATRATIRAGAIELLRCSVKSISSSAVGSVVGGVLGAFLGAGPGSVAGTVTGIKIGAAVGAGVGIAWCMSDVWDQVTAVYDNAVNPVVASVDEVFADNSMSSTRTVAIVPTGKSAAAFAAATTAPAFTSGVARQVEVFVDFKSLSAADASGPPAVAGLVADFNGLAATWQTLRSKFDFLDVPSLTLPAAPRVTVRKRVPASYLSVPAVSLANATATTTGSDSTWMVTINNPTQGDDHDFTYTVRFKFPEFPDQDRVRSGLLRPSRYVVAALEVTPDTVVVDRSVTLVWAARDSSGDRLTDSLLAGRKPTWESAQTSIATVGATSGSVHGVTGGSAAITASLETGHATATVLVIPDITGTYTLKEENGFGVPGVTYADTVYTITTSSGSVTLRADGTFSFVRAATGTNTKTHVNYDEGGAGSGTYTVNATGTALTFEVTAQEGVPLTFGSGSVSGNTLTIGVTTPEGSGSAVLVKSP
jgi:uncharacterized protein YcfJ